MITLTSVSIAVLTIAALALLAGLALPVTAQDGSGFDFKATALDGSPFSGQAIAGKAVLLDFWGSWCAPCVHAFPTLRRLHADFGETLQVVGLAYYSGELSDIAAAAAEHSLDYTILEGSEEALDKFEVFAFPSYVMLSPEGEVLFAQAGEVDDLYEKVAQALARLQ